MLVNKLFVTVLQALLTLLQTLTVCNFIRSASVHENDFKFHEFMMKVMPISYSLSEAVQFSSVSFASSSDKRYLRRVYFGNCAAQDLFCNRFCIQSPFF